MLSQGMAAGTKSMGGGEIFLEMSAAERKTRELVTGIFGFPARSVAGIDEYLAGATEIHLGKRIAKILVAMPQDVRKASSSNDAEISRVASYVAASPNGSYVGRRWGLSASS